MSSLQTPTPSAETASASQQDSRSGAPFAIMTALFFLWGFMTVFNDILIPRFKAAFTLSYFEAMLVQFAFFGAYFVGSLIYFLISITSGDPLARLGYKKGVIIGLLAASAGSLLFWPAANLASYPLFLTALFIVGLGFAMLQIAANPYVTILGPERTASSRLNLAQGFNSVGTTLGPLVGGYLIFKYFAIAGDHGAASVRIPYLGFALVFALLALVFRFLHLPQIGATHMERGAGALRHPHVLLGALAIFMYVGGEVSVGSSIINFLGQPNIAGLGEYEASDYVALYWGGLLIGRFMGAVELSELAASRKTLLLALIPSAGALALLLSRGTAQTLPMLPLLFAAWLLFKFGRGRAGTTLTLFSLMVVALLGVAVFTQGHLAMWCVVGVGLFTSIGWSNTFSLAIEGLGPLKGQASSLLVMAILGGAVLPPLQGYLADHFGIQASFLVPMLAYAYVAYYGLLGHRVGRKAS